MEYRIFCLLLALLLLPACVPATAPLASAPPALPRAAPARDSSDVRYEEEQKTLVAEWEWYAGGGW